MGEKWPDSKVAIKEWTLMTKTVPTKPKLLPEEEVKVEGTEDRDFLGSGNFILKGLFRR
jgi:hypothetical protein